MFLGQRPLSEKSPEGLCVCVCVCVFGRYVVTQVQSIIQTNCKCSARMKTGLGGALSAEALKLTQTGSQNCYVKFRR